MIADRQSNPALQIFGEFQSPPPEEALSLVFTVGATPAENRWCTYRLSATFLADYFSLLVPVSEAVSEAEAEMIGSIAVIANELLENAMKFGEAKPEQPIILSVERGPASLTVLTRNYTSSKTAQALCSFIQTLSYASPAELLIEQMERNAADKDSICSGLGILTMMSDYSAKVGWQLEACGEDVLVTTKIQISLYWQIFRPR